MSDSIYNTAIGIFDSGLGGLSVWRELVKYIPQRSLYYVSDSAFCPYGPRPASEVIARGQLISQFLIDRGCGLIVLACNTATAACLSSLRQSFSLPFVGMEPAVKPAALHSQTGVVGVLATEGTFRGSLYKETSQRFASHVQVLETVGAGLVELIEQGRLDDPETNALLKRYIDPMLEAGADHLVLGCTHYPFLIPAIEKITLGRLQIIDPAPAVALHTAQLAASLPPALAPVAYHFYATGSVEALRQRAEALPQLDKPCTFVGEQPMP
jgi:glutamate racemase